MNLLPLASRMIKYDWIQFLGPDKSRLNIRIHYCEVCTQVWAFWAEAPDCDMCGRPIVLEYSQAQIIVTCKLGELTWAHLDAARAAK